MTRRSVWLVLLALALAGGAGCGGRYVTVSPERVAGRNDPAWVIVSEPHPPQAARRTTPPEPPAPPQAP